MLLRSDDGKEFELGPETLVGREEECQVVLAEEHVSRYHAKITVINNKVRIEDLNSKNGTYVNGKKLTQVRDVGIGDEICFDQMIFRIVTSDSGSAKSTLFRSPSKIEFQKDDVAKPDPLKVTGERIELVGEFKESKESTAGKESGIGGSSIAKKSATSKESPKPEQEAQSSFISSNIEDFDATNNIKPSALNSQDVSPINDELKPQATASTSEGDVLIDDADSKHSALEFDLIDDESFARIASLAQAKEGENKPHVQSLHGVEPEPTRDAPRAPKLNIKKPNSSDAQQGKDIPAGSAHEKRLGYDAPDNNELQSHEEPLGSDETTRFDVNHLRARDQLSRSDDSSRVQDGAFLVALSAPLRGHEFVMNDFTSSEVIVGRDDVCDIVLHDTTVSNRHARFYQVENRWCVANLGATNGVKVNGEAVDHAWLSQDDVVKLGRMELQFSLKGLGPRGADEIAASLFAKEKAKDRSSKLPWMVGVAFLSLLLVLFSLLFFFGGYR